MSFRPIIAGVFLTVLPMVSPARASIDDAMAHAATVLQGRGATGVAIVAVAKGRTYYLNAGTRDRAGDPVTENTLFETASISKIFTTTLLGIDVARGRTSLNARITKYFHRRLTPEMRNATLAMLATYTAGIPSIPPGLVGHPATEWSIDSYPVSSFLRFIGRVRPQTLPASLSYSDSSVGFLALCLGHMSLQNWEALQKENLYYPLGMYDTAAILNPDQESRLAVGVQPDGSAAPRWPLDPFAAADGVKSTSHDLGNFLAAELGRRPGVPSGVRQGMEIATRPRFSIADGAELQALSWTWNPAFVHGKPVWIIMKGGNLVGFSSRICFSRNLGVGVAILGNHPNLPTQEVATKLLQQIAEEVNSASSVKADR